MANKTRVRVELNTRFVPHHARPEDRAAALEQAFRFMKITFRRQCDAYGILRSFKDHEYFESKPRKEKKKRKEAALARIKDLEISQNPQQRNYNNGS